ncbi:hypothetical protein BDZ85DRAFT_261013 [Elsinoe ampelina]|uniref:Uncharacterized protein n=1 Tax=Elsinoe ampelina TaxID=302913 RepID=A0A6A6GFM6_9PEZI|nr:hypothetical protein BDZ85DRAFT_261013 [Elsinoe ampelina]
MVCRAQTLNGLLPSSHLLLPEYTDDSLRSASTLRRSRWFPSFVKFMPFYWPTSGSKSMSQMIRSITSSSSEALPISYTCSCLSNLLYYKTRDLSLISPHHHTFIQLNQSHKNSLSTSSPESLSTNLKMSYSSSSSYTSSGRSGGSSRSTGTRTSHGSSRGQSSNANAHDISSSTLSGSNSIHYSSPSGSGSSGSYYSSSSGGSRSHGSSSGSSRSSGSRSAWSTGYNR